jgi:hypothetical protein
MLILWLLPLYFVRLTKTTTYMAHLLTLVFRPEEIQQLLDLNPKKIVIRSVLEEGRLDDGERAGIVKVFADATTEGGEVLDTIEGCPVPPCTADDNTSMK